MRRVTSTSNPAVKAAAALHRARNRHTTGRTLVEGPGPVAAALEAGIVPETYFTTSFDAEAARAAELGAEVLVVDEPVLRRVAATDHPRGPVAVIAIPTPTRPRPVPTLVLAGLADPGNAGTLIRSAAAFGYDVAVTPGTVDVWNPKAIRAAAGAHFAVTIVTALDLSDLRAVGLTIVGTFPTGGDAPDALRLPSPPAVVVGSEAHGLDDRGGIDVAVTIPTTGAVESLNAAVAGSLVMYTLGTSRHR